MLLDGFPRSLDQVGADLRYFITRTLSHMTETICMNKKML
jgi:hypothetical protein